MIESDATPVIGNALTPVAGHNLVLDTDGTRNGTVVDTALLVSMLDVTGTSLGQYFEDRVLFNCLQTLTAQCGPALQQGALIAASKHH